MAGRMKWILLPVLMLLLSATVFSQTKYKLAYTGSQVDSAIKRVLENSIGNSTAAGFIPRMVGTDSLTTAYMSVGFVMDSSTIYVGRKYIFFYCPLSIVIDTLNVVGIGTSSSVTVDIHYGEDVSAAGTAIITTPSAATSVTVGTRVATFNSATVPNGNWVWIEFDAVATKPASLAIILMYHYAA